MIDYLNETPLKEPLIFDTHSHYDDEKFTPFIDELFQRLPKCGVGGIITCGYDLSSSIRAIELAEKYDFVYAAVGMHPENIDNPYELSEIEQLLSHKKCVAIGEIGLDYYWRQDNKGLQKEIFIKQLELSLKYNMPVIIHDREAHGDTLDIIKKYKPKGVLHSFSGSIEMAKELLKLGMYIGIGGVITFKNAKKLPEVVAMLPDDKILLETDAPYLAPVPFRGKINNSAMIYLVAEKIAELKNTEPQKILNLTFKNALNLFKI